MTSAPSIPSPHTRDLAAILALASFCGLAAPAWAQVDTGPQQQRMPWRGGTTLDSVVGVRTNVGTGTGTIIDKRVDPRTGMGWLCVLTADHVVAGAANIRIAFGDNAAEGLFGGVIGPAVEVYRGQPAARVGGLDGVDIAVVRIRFGMPNAFYNAIRPATLAPWQPGDPGTVLGGVINQFTEVGYGGTATFVNGGLDFGAADGNKRFQNNRLERVVNMNYRHPVTNDAYIYPAVDWTFDRAAAQATNMGVPLPAGQQPFLVAEGLSYGGDSGGPYFAYAGPIDAQNVAAFNRPGANNWIMGGMPLRSDFLFVVHCFGLGMREPGVTPYADLGAMPPVRTGGGGVPITPAYAAWIQARCALAFPCDYPAPLVKPRTALGGIAFCEDFEVCTLCGGLIGCNGWEPWYIPPPVDGQIVPGHPGSISGGNALKYLATQSDCVHFLNQTNRMFYLSAMTYVPAGAVGEGYIILCSEYNSLGPPTTWASQVQFSGTRGTVRNDAGGFTVSPTLPLLRDQWVQWEAMVDIRPGFDRFHDVYGGQQLTLSEHVTPGVIMKWTDNALNTPGSPAVIKIVNLYGAGIDGMLVDDFVSTCFADIDQSTGCGVVDIFDFLKFSNYFGAQHPIACNADTTTGLGICDIFDFLVFSNLFDQGCR